MRPSSLIHVEITCFNCESSVKIEVEPYVSAKVAGPPERWVPAEGGAFEPECCPNCHATFDPDVIWEAVGAYEEAAYDDYVNHKIDEARGK